MANIAKNSFTIDQISKDALTKIANKYWSNITGIKLEPYNKNLIDDIYLNEISKSKFVYAIVLKSSELKFMIVCDYIFYK